MNGRSFSKIIRIISFKNCVKWSLLLYCSILSKLKTVLSVMGLDCLMISSIIFASARIFPKSGVFTSLIISSYAFWIYNNYSSDIFDTAWERRSDIFSTRFNELISTYWVATLPILNFRLLFFTDYLSAWLIASAITPYTLLSMPKDAYMPSLMNFWV